MISDKYNSYVAKYLEELAYLAGTLQLVKEKDALLAIREKNTASI